MLSESSIEVENLGKCFHIYEKPIHRLQQFFFPHLDRFLELDSKKYYQEYWALRNVSFEVKKGETVGIVGRNGSGKSTLLQMICGTLAPTNGTVRVKGRLAALLELGSGFNPEFTGRENVFLNGAILGLSTQEVDSRLGDIAEFAEIGEFIDQPVKTYSSGMVLRLAFAVAINVDPEILVVDEALSVGDERFQRKCFSRIEQIRANGATILFVSHSGSQVVELCDRAILLDAGENLVIGKPATIVGNYQKLLYAPLAQQNSIREWLRLSGNGTDDTVPAALTDALLPSTSVAELVARESYDPTLVPTSTIAYESRGAIIESPGVFSLDGKRLNNLVGGSVYLYVYVVRFQKSVANARFGMLIKTISGMELGGSVTAGSGRSGLATVDAGASVRVEFKFRCALTPGIYFLNAGVLAEVNEGETFFHRLIDADMFRVLPEKQSLVTGTVDFECSSRIDMLDTPA